MTKEHPSALRRTMIESTVGNVRRTSYDLPDAKNPKHAYGFEIVRDPESAGEVVGKWVQATPSPAAKSGRSFIETNRQATLNRCLSAGEARRFANEHPDIIVKSAAKSKAGFVPTNDITYGIKSKESEDINALVQARYTSFSTENADCPDFSNMKIKGKLPLPRETRASQGKDVRLHSSRQAGSDKKDPEHLFKMSKFKKVGSVLCAQPNAYSTSGGGGGTADNAEFAMLSRQNVLKLGAHSGFAPLVVVVDVDLEELRTLAAVAIRPREHEQDWIS